VTLVEAAKLLLEKLALSNVPGPREGRTSLEGIVLQRQLGFEALSLLRNRVIAID